MTDQQTPQEQSTPDDLVAEFENFGRNLKESFRKLWESEERKNWQQDLEEGLSRIGESIDQAVKEFQESPAGQRVKTSAEDFQERLRMGEVGESLRSEMVKVLRKINAELEKIAGQFASRSEDE